MTLELNFTIQGTLQGAEGKDDVSRGGNHSKTTVCSGNVRSWGTGLGLKFLSS